MPSKPQQSGDTPPQSLDALRCEIDRLDDRLLELVEQRLSASATVAALKEAESNRFLKLRPRREAKVIERLVAKARLAPPPLVTELWRALMAYGLQAQVQTELMLCAVRDPASLEAQVRTRFGCAATILWADTPAKALAAAAGREAVAVIEEGLEFVLDGDLVIFDRLLDSDGGRLAVAIGRVAPDEVVA
jgi:chorismate mutase